MSTTEELEILKEQNDGFRKGVQKLPGEVKLTLLARVAVGYRDDVTNEEVIQAVRDQELNEPTNAHGQITVKGIEFHWQILYLDMHTKLEKTSPVPYDFGRTFRRLVIYDPETEERPL